MTLILLVTVLIVYLVLLVTRYKKKNKSDVKMYFVKQLQNISL